MEVEGYEVSWSPNRKHITFTCPNGRKCRGSSLHDETFLKEKLEMLFLYRQATPRQWSRMMGGWENWPLGGSRWPLTWGAMTNSSSLHRLPGQPADQHNRLQHRR